MEVSLDAVLLDAAALLLPFVLAELEPTELGAELVACDVGDVEAAVEADDEGPPRIEEIGLRVILN